MHTANDIFKVLRTDMINQWVNYLWARVLVLNHTHPHRTVGSLCEVTWRHLPKHTESGRHGLHIWNLSVPWSVISLVITAPLLKVSIATVTFPEALLYLTHFNGTFFIHLMFKMRKYSSKLKRGQNLKFSTET